MSYNSQGVNLWNVFFKLKERNTTVNTELIAGIVVDNPSTLVDLASFNLLGQTWSDIMPKLVTICALLAIVIMSIKKLRGAVLIGIAFGLISYIIISVFCGDIKKIKASSWIIAALFIAMLLLTH